MKLNRLLAGCLVVAAWLSNVLAQTQIDLRTQAKRVDFSNAGSTKPSKTGIVLPALCATGETFLKMNAKPGSNLYVCTAVNVWTVQGSALPDYLAGSYGKVLTNDDAGMGWESLGGDVSGGPDALMVIRLQGRPVAAAAPSDGHVLSWDGTQWMPRALQMPALTGDVTTSAGSTLTTLNSVNPLPGTCGDATHVCQVTTNAKGLVTQQTAVAVAGVGSGINSLNGLSAPNQNFVNDTNVTVSSAGANHTLGWNGLLGLMRGGLNANLSNTGGAHQVLQQSSSGAPVTVGQLTPADIAGLAASATTDATDASNISSGTLGAGRLPQFTGGQVTSPAPGSTVLNIGAGSVTNAMLDGSIATGKLASRQGTDTNVLTAATDSGVTGAPWCKSVNGGATTIGCSTGEGTVTVVGAGTLTSTALVTGGGTQALQTPAATATMDSSGNIQTPGTVTAGLGGSTAGAWAFVQGTATAAPANSVGFQAPASVTSAYRITLPAAPANGVVRRTSDTPSVESVSPISAGDMPAFTGDVTTSAGAVATSLAAKFKSDTWSFNLGTDNAPADLVAADIGPQGRIFMVPVACTISEITVAANAGTPSVIVRKNHAGTQTNLLSGTLATGSAGAVACAATGTACADGTAKSGTVSILTTSSTNVLAAGDWLETTSGVASTGAKRISVAVTCVRN